MASKKGVAQTPTLECCMCGDYGLPEELISCRSRHFRSQHRYSSDLYPKAESNTLCNWCLKEDRVKRMKEAIANCSLSSTCSSSIRNSKKKVVKTGDSDNIVVGLKLQRCATFQFHLNIPIKKKRSPERLSVNRSKQCLEVRFDDISSSKRFVISSVNMYAKDITLWSERGHNICNL